MECQWHLSPPERTLFRHFVPESVRPVHVPSSIHSGEGLVLGPPRAFEPSDVRLERLDGLAVLETDILLDVFLEYDDGIRVLLGLA